MVRDEIKWGEATEAQKQFLLEGLLFEGRILIAGCIFLNKPLTGARVSMVEWYGFRLMIERDDPLLKRLPDPFPPDPNEWEDWEDED